MLIKWWKKTSPAHGSATYDKKIYNNILSELRFMIKKLQYILCEIRTPDGQTL